MSSPLLEIRAATAGYDGATVLRSMNLSVDPGEVVALLGANGAGKTTTLRLASALVRPTSGQVDFCGEDISRLAPHQLARRGLAHVAEGRSVFFGLTVAEHFRVGYRGERLDIGQAFGYFPALEPLKNRRAGFLSGGEQQMLAVARALARGPKLLLLDELSLGLAPVIVKSLLPVIHRFAKEREVGVLIVEQHVEMALSIADRGMVLSHGETVLQEQAATLLRDAHLVEASYLGDSDTVLADG